MGIQVPEAARQLLAQEEKFKIYFNQLTYALKASAHIHFSLFDKLLRWCLHLFPQIFLTCSCLFEEDLVNAVLTCVVRGSNCMTSLSWHQIAMA